MAGNWECTRVVQMDPLTAAKTEQPMAGLKADRWDERWADPTVVRRVSRMVASWVCHWAAMMVCQMVETMESPRVVSSAASMDSC